MVSDRYKFRVQRVFIGANRRFQLRVGLDGDRDVEFIPVYFSAYAKILPLKLGHETEAQALQEEEELLNWLRAPQSRS
jgi:hypothetical protein